MTATHSSPPPEPDNSLTRVASWLHSAADIRLAWLQYALAHPPLIPDYATASFRAARLADKHLPHVIDYNGRRIILRDWFDLPAAEEVIRACAFGKDRATWLRVSDYFVVPITPANVLGALALLHQGRYQAFDGLIDLPPRPQIVRFLPAATEFVRAAGLLDTAATVEAV